MPRIRSTSRARLGTLCAALALCVTASLAVAVPAGADPVAEPLVAAKGDTAKTAKKDGKQQRYSPKTGVRINDPRNGSKRAVISTIVNSIKSTRPGQDIYIVTWNLASPVIVRELLRANTRGVTVRFLAAKQKVEAQPKGGDYWRLKRGLRTVSKTNPQAKNARSWARSCDRSCRGSRGIAHSKYYLFSKSGTSEHVVISSSANATEVAANSQWNDAFVLVGSEKMYDFFVNVFKESSRDKLVKPAYTTLKLDNVLGYSYPWSGSTAKGDRAMNELNRITCRGAKGAGINGRTKIRIAQDAIIDKRGQKLARKLRTLYQQGCNIRIVYSLMNTKARQILKSTSRGPIPMRQIVQDFDGDGVYDRYLHSKVMTVGGNYAGDRGARVAWQGSENWSGLAKLSDEQGLKLWRDGVEKRYASWVDALFTNPPKRGGSTDGTTTEFRRVPGVDPYRIIRANLG